MKRPRTQIRRTRRSVLGAIAGSMAAATVGGKAVSDPEAFRQISKSMWVWKTEPAEFPSLGEFARRWNITRALLSLPSSTLDRLMAGDRDIAGRIRKLRDTGLEVVALTGDPSWVEYDRLPRSISKILDIAARQKLFDGLDLDVEPHVLSGWRKGGVHRERLMLGHLALIESTAKRAPGLSLGAALHPIYAKLALPDGQNYLDALCRRLQSVSLMAYRNRPKATIDWAEPAFPILERAKVPWRSGVLVHDSKEAGISYVGWQQSRFVADMTELDLQLRSLPSVDYCRGLIFEDYKGLSVILDG